MRSGAEIVTDVRGIRQMEDNKAAFLPRLMSQFLMFFGFKDLTSSGMTRRKEEKCRYKTNRKKKDEMRGKERSNEKGKADLICFVQVPRKHNKRHLCKFLTEVYFIFFIFILWMFKFSIFISVIAKFRVQ